MAASAIRLRGFSDLQRLFLNAVPKTKRGLQEVTEGTIRLMQADAQSRVAVDTGKARQAITYELSKGGLVASLSCNVAYWAYLEFGTGGLVDIPEGFEDLAAPYKGSGKRQINLPARPFMVPAFLKYREVYYKGVENILDKIWS